MSARAEVMVLIPAYNEADRIGAVVSRVRTVVPDARIVVIDDGSRDGTASVAAAAGAEVLSHAVNLGYGSALQTGYLFARARGIDRLVQLDADGQHEPGCIVDLLAALDRGFDVAVGSRYLSDQPPSVGFARRVGARLFGRIATLWTGVRITDPTSGFQALSHRAIRHLVRDSFPEDYPDTDVLIDLHRAGLKITEVPVRMYPRRGGASMHRGSKVAFYAYKMVLNLSLLPVRRPSPFRAGRSAG
ncbi:MAG TPA: glycosyltransferase family 2 protein [Planctomycetota bacterium]|nr:glycosyltransferase family 2 protein [Planctomycetota bacterium]